MFPPEKRVTNGTIVWLVERVQKFPFTTSRSSCGWLYGLSVLMPARIPNSSTTGYLVMKSPTVRSGQATAAVTRIVLKGRQLHIHPLSYTRKSDNGRNRSRGTLAWQRLRCNTLLPAC